MAAVHPFHVFANKFLMDEYHAWAGRVYLLLQSAHQLRACMDRAIADASRWTRDIDWDDGEAPQHWLHCGNPVLGRYKEAARDLLALLAVRSRIGSGTHFFVVYRLAHDVVLLHPPHSWQKWGWLFIDAFFAANPSASVEAAQNMMRTWSSVRIRLEIFYDVCGEPRIPLPMVPDSLETGLEYFGDSGAHWILEV